MRMTRVDLAIVGLFATVALVYVGVFHYRAPYFDEWDLVPLLRATDAGELTLGRLFELHGGHWHAASYALLAPLARMTQWSHLAESMASLVFVAGACALALRLAANFAALAAAGARFTPYAAVTAFLVFSLDQASNLLWGFQLSVFQSQFGVLLALAALTERRLGALHLTAALLGVGLGAASYATAFVMAPLGLALVLVHGGASVGRRALFALLWAALTGAICLAFVFAQHGEPYGGGFDASDLARPDFAAFLALFQLNYLGAAMTRFASDLVIPVALAGLVGVGACAAVLLRGGAHWRALTIPLALCACGVGAGVLCAFGRYDFGPDQGGNARYISFATTFWLGAGLLALAALPRLRGKPARNALIAVFALLVLLKVGNSVQSAVKHAGISCEVAAVAERMRADPAAAAEAARTIALDRQDVAAQIAFMREKRWSAFRETR